MPPLRGWTLADSASPPSFDKLSLKCVWKGTAFQPCRQKQETPGFRDCVRTEILNMKVKQTPSKYSREAAACDSPGRKSRVVCISKSESRWDGTSSHTHSLPLGFTMALLRYGETLEEEKKMRG